MSVRVITAVLDGSQHSATELLALVVLADYSDDDGNSYPSVASLARKCRMTSRNANYVLRTLQESGELRVLKNEGPKGTNRYRIILSRLVRPLKPASPLKPNSAHATEAAFTPEARFTLKPGSPTPEAGFPKPLKPPSDEPSLNRQEPSPPVRQRAGGGDPEGFAEFWSAWPTSVRKQDRKKCAEKWKRAGLRANLPTILAHVEAMKGTKQWCDGYEPAPFTYLNGERWNDGMPPPERHLTSAGARSPMHADETFI